MHLDVGADLDAGGVLDVFLQQRLGADPRERIGCPQQQCGEKDQAQRLKQDAPAFRR
jgi:hypothetical protein